MNRVALLLALCLAGSVKADTHMQVEASLLQSVMLARLDKPRKVEMLLVDGKPIKGVATAAATRGLQVDLDTKPPVSELVPYERIQEVRLDMGPSLGWRIGGGILGFWGGAALGFPIAYTTDGSWEGAAAVYGLTAAGTYAGIKLGGKNRNWLVLEVQP